ncbi:CDP-glycerol glycerophosphotransferase family protein [Streptomyces sp. AM 4-1-1]|uniref:CDP-glycerol glycerophosphotransferase family protein n=1 Tax=Streptomyces sp. AM 4-1-1 TaxID=3028710 RepID=UPI0023B94925|nr:CDP-glycerol glycerophosphotransferase family protein [Streptomyces sp. AM 4-1-1]WEH37446.1 CDP-glycerol glycerophosphotransferase family protein [Streptomyces sp. AM 4-1-1]
MRFFPETPAEERPAFHAAAKDFLERADPKLVRRFSPLARAKWHLAATGRGDELVELLRHERANPGVFAVRGLRRPRTQLPGVDGSSLPPAVRHLTRGELPVRSRLTELAWENGRLTARGYAYIPNVPSATGRRSLRIAALRRRGTKSTIPLRLRTVLEPRATAEADEHRYDWSGFEISVDPARLRSRGRWQPGEWLMGIGIPRRGGMSVGGVMKGDAGSAGHGQVRTLADGVRLVVGHDRGRLLLRVDVVPAEIESQEADGDGLTVTLRSRGTADDGRTPTALRLVHGATGREPAGRESAGRGATGRETDHPLEKRGVGGDGWVRYTARLPFAGLPVDGVAAGRARTLGAFIVFADGTTRRATAVEGLRPLVHPLPGGQELAVAADDERTYVPRVRVVSPVVDRVEWAEDGELLLAGTYPAPGGGSMKLILRHERRGEDLTVPVECVDGRFTARLRPDAVPGYGGTLPLREGRWLPYFRPRDTWDHTRDVPMTVRPDLTGPLPAVRRGDRRTYTVERTDHDRIFIESGPVLGADARGGYRQRRLRETHTRTQRKLPLRDTVLYDSFGGRQFSDSPRAVHRELARRRVDVEHLVVVRDQQVELPPGVRGVEWASEEWYEALARSRYIVTNDDLGEWFVRREGQIVVQTWHGAPLTRVGADLLGTERADLAHIATLEERSRQYSFFVTPNALSTPVMKRALRLECEILEAGYPRNDVFHAHDRVRTASAVRERLGIPEGRKVVLYAPTWRPGRGSADPENRTAPAERIDAVAARGALGDDHVLLHRRHHKEVGGVPGAGDGFVWDVTYYPDIADLYLITDVLVTDYSSALFDFAHSGRPMLFLTYDLEHHRDSLGGFSYDFFTARPPGPLLRTSGELVRAIRGIDAVTAEHRENYAQFRVDFCEPSDGFASARVADRMLDLGKGLD